MDQNDILYVLENRCLYLNMVGEIRHTLCVGLDTLIRQMIQQNQVDKFVVDLRQTSFLDSTSLGIIARMAKHMQNNSSDKPILISTNDDIDQILNSVQFNTIAQIVTSWDNLPEQYIEIDIHPKETRNPREIVLESHKELTRINKDNLDKFVGVIESLEKKYNRDRKNNRSKDS